MSPRIVAIHQPNYLPSCRFFHKMKSCDVFVLLDSVLYSKNSYINRNSLKDAHGSVWLTVPVKRRNLLSTQIRDVKIDSSTKWARRHWKSITTLYSRSRFFDSFRAEFESVYEREWEHLCELNLALISMISRLFSIEKQLVRSSELMVSGSRSSLIIEICKKIGADVYLSGTSGRTYLDQRAFEASGINLQYQDYQPESYPQLYGPFIPTLSSIDALFNIAALPAHAAKQSGVQASGFHTLDSASTSVT
jgi:WbqC-like protein family